jgi:hypothetical protein
MAKVPFSADSAPFPARRLPLFSGLLWPAGSMCRPAMVPVRPSDSAIRN